MQAVGRRARGRAHAADDEQQHSSSTEGAEGAREEKKVVVVFPRCSGCFEGGGRLLLAGRTLAPNPLCGPSCCPAPLQIFILTAGILTPRVISARCRPMTPNGRQQGYTRSLTIAINLPDISRTSAASGTADGPPQPSSHTLRTRCELLKRPPRERPLPARAHEHPSAPTARHACALGGILPAPTAVTLFLNYHLRTLAPSLHVISHISCFGPASKALEHAPQRFAFHARRQHSRVAVNRSTSDLGKRLLHKDKDIRAPAVNHLCSRSCFDRNCSIALLPATIAYYPTITHARLTYENSSPTASPSC